MIPREIFDGLMRSHHVNHGAKMVDGDKEYHLRSVYPPYRDSKIVVATLFVDVDADKPAPSGFEVSCDETFAWKSIPLSQVPQSSVDDWDFWDEY